MDGSDGQAREKENYLLTKSSSTAHIPENSRAKNTKRAYANFDKDLAVKMFGYRVDFKKKNMAIKVPDADVPQTHKPLQRFVNDIITELSQGYAQIPKFYSKQHILVPLPDELNEEEYIEKIEQERQEAKAKQPNEEPVNESALATD